jgi:anti-anti-sigma regulatory factor/HPt (histidine-containing phosphotransfer) domain-containing protein
VSAAAVQDPFILRCDGALTLATAAQWRQQIQSALGGNGRVLVDLGAADDVDVTFIQLLVSAKKTADAAGKHIGVCSVSEKLDGAAVAEAELPAREIAPMSAPAAPVAAQAPDDIDRAAIDTLIGEIGVQAVQQSLDVFFGEMSARLSALEGYAGDTCNAGVTRETHLLKGTAGTFGLKQFAAEVVAFEQDAAELGTDAYTAALNRMAATMRRSQSTLRLMVGTGG